jgi:hypothetical protein
MLDRASLRLNEPRRFGKTSLLTKLVDTPAPGWCCVKQSFQGVRTVEEMAARALSGIAHHQRLSTRVRKITKPFLSAAKLTATVQNVTFELSAPFRDDPLAALECALRDVGAALGTQRLLLAWDEVPDMLLDIGNAQGFETAQNLLETMRRHRDEQANSPIRWLITGSVGLHHVLHRMPGGDSLVNDLDNLPLGPLSPVWSRWLAASVLLGADVQANEAAIAAMVDISGGIPFLIHLIAKEARDRRYPAITVHDVGELFDLAVDDLDQSQSMTHLLTRIEPHYGKNARVAEWILDRVAQQPMTHGQLRVAAEQDRMRLPRDLDLPRLLTWLRLDHYLDVGPSTPAVYDWRYMPLKNVWQRRRR